MTEREVLDALSQARERFSPLQLESITAEPRAQRFDARVTIAWRGCVVPFMAEIKTRSAPKMVADAVMRLRAIRNEQSAECLLIVPYLSKAIVEILERERMNAIDLNGNYFIQTRQMLAIRLDRPNEYRESQSIRNIFSGYSSLVGRLFLTGRRTFPSVNAVWAAIREKGGELSLSAVSKVLAGFERELIIEKSRSEIRLIQPDKLLKSLEEGYRLPKVVATMRCKLPGLGQPMPVQLINLIPNAKWMIAGENSASRYEISASSGPLNVYIAGPRLPGQADLLRVYEEDRFPNVTFRWLEAAFPLFDARSFEAVDWASPVQCCLELSRLGKREQEAAAGIRQAILRELK
ncbi:MAG: hypothetical protein HY928_16450 [Elusimicrobia bacterium]|nr:hypothetical protein [Elusimicrobiota bacterium]